MLGADLLVAPVMDEAIRPGARKPHTRGDTRDIDETIDCGRYRDRAPHAGARTHLD